MTGAPMPMQTPDPLAVEQWIGDALDALGVTSDEVAATLAAHEAVAGSDVDDDPVVLYLQWHLDPGEVNVRVATCDIESVSYIVRSRGGTTWAHARTGLPSPVMVYNCRADAGDFPFLQPARA